MAKRGSISEKDSAAMYYFNKKQYETALPLFEELLGVYRGTGRYEKMMYYNAFTRYSLGDYISGNVFFDEYTKAFPTGEFAEECAFLRAKCYDKMTSPYYLDQTDTYKAIEGYELFIKQYPTSIKVKMAEEAIAEMKNRLMEKAYHQAVLYHKIGYHKAASIAFRNFSLEFPNSPYKEEAYFKMLVSNIDFAKESIEEKQLERYEDAIEIYYKFVDKFPSSKKIKDAEVLFNSASKAVEKLKGSQIKESDTKVK